ncbi:hypothetical protein [Citrobacter amalonaticus]|uniref:HNH endonuclease n=1 Tax=Citrobacter amalonaticus TaxID=35703 RepID=A0A6N2WYT3_CITAM|nr:hypothetical protein [Enterobacter sp. RHBSTW-01064]MBA7751381.1 hypothetical protein [Enterobacter sp. RHBSTW-01064]HBU6573793.1 hypothetical protein [Citrobacter amalonaticus]HCB1822952.1 hypothetical protein [Citrobacter amalonaticus]HCB1901299.1 hypothetical protein [Citrobacter amalonaticus]
MMLGPSHLPIKNNINRMILRRKEYYLQLKKFFDGEIQWNHSSLSILKKKLRLNLRVQQDGRCIYCRRLILNERRNVYEDIEHFLDKSKDYYRRWAFTYINLSLACHACNIQKSNRDLGTQDHRNSASYPAGVGIYSWLHPYFDDYHANLIVGKGWTYSLRPNAPAAMQADRMINECKLDEVQTIEAYSEDIKKRILRLTVLAHKANKSQRYALSNRLLEESIRYQEEQWHNY